MATTSTTNPATQANQLQRYFSRKLLTKIKEVLVYAQFAKKESLPLHMGAKTMRFFRFGPPKIDGIQVLVEGVPIAEADYRELTLEFVDVDLVQYGQVIAITDVLNDISLFNQVEEAVETNADDAALHCDTLIRNELAIHTGTVGGINYATKNYQYAQAATTFGGVYNAGSYSANFTMTPGDLLDAATALKVNKAPRFDGYYIGVLAPEASRDLMAADDVWQRVSAYSDREQIYKGEIGKLFGVRVMEATNGFRSNTQGTYNAAGVNFSSFVFGRGAFGAPNLGSYSPVSPRVTIVRGADKSDPLNQIAAKIGFKTFYAAKILQPKWIVEIYSQSGFGQ